MINTLKFFRIICFIAAIAALVYVFVDVSEQYESLARIERTAPGTAEMVKYTAFSTVIFTAGPLLVAIGLTILISRKKREEEERKRIRGEKIKHQLSANPQVVSNWGSHPPPEGSERQEMAEIQLIRAGRGFSFDRC